MFIKQKLRQYLYNIRQKQWQVGDEYNKMILVWDDSDHRFSHQKTDVWHPEIGKVKIPFAYTEDCDTIYRRLASAYEDRFGSRMID